MRFAYSHSAAKFWLHCFCFVRSSLYLRTANMIDRPTIDRILDATNIVDVVSDFVSLRKRGTSYKGLCPFHDDTTPSFSVSPAKGVYKCFACGKAGNAVNFIMEHEQMTYPDALRWLAKKYHIEIVERELTDEERQAQTERESMMIVNEWAANYFHNILLNDADGQAIGLQYFRQRGFRDDIIERFRLGFAPRRRTALVDEAQKKGYKAEFLQKTGLCYEVEDSQRNGNDVEAQEGSDEEQTNEATVRKKLIDRFSNRVIFPWISVGGRVVAFGGRLLDMRTKGVAQKYVNSPDSDIYHKDHELYGIFQAKRQIVKEDRVYMVEGYTDVISMHQCGIENVVANSGTALSIYQIRLLHRFTQNVTLLYDGDDAGIHAALRGTDMLLAEGMNIKVLLLPDQEDPDSFARKHTAADFRQYIEEHQTDFMQFKTDVLLKGVTDPIKRSEAISSIVKSISVIKDPIIRATYIKDCSNRIGIAEQTLITQMNRFIRDERNRPGYQTTTQGNQSVNQPDGQSNISTTNRPTNQPDDKLTAADIHFDRTTKEKSLVETTERNIVEMVVRYGEKRILHDVEVEEGKTKDLSVLDFIYYDLNEGAIPLTNPIYNKVLEEGYQHKDDDGFSAEKFFINHPDIEISQLATQLSIDEYRLTESLQMKYSDDSILHKIRHLLLDYRLCQIEMQLRTVKKKIQQSLDNPEDIESLMQELSTLMEQRNKYANNLGKDIIN